MRINQNIMAINAHRRLNVNQEASSKAMEKLSSGMRINRAGDDAAGLAISEKMRGQIRGLKQAQRNAQDGISLILTAEGALNETHSILQRMRELAVQAATDTNTIEDREEIQKEMDQLTTEIQRIAADTQFNTQALLDGTYDGKVFHIGSNEGQNVGLSIQDMGVDKLGVVFGGAEASGTAQIGEDDNAVTVTITGGTDAAYNGIKVEFKSGASEPAAAWGNGESSKTLTITLKNEEEYNAAAIQELVDAATTAPSIDNFSLTIDFTGNLKVPESEWAGGSITLSGAKPPSEAPDEDAESLQGIDVSSSQQAANDAIAAIDDAIVLVSAERSKLGAMQNRLEHTIANLGTAAENLQAAESRIRDLDMAEEIMVLTKNNILQQAATAMLAQANMAPQSVLQLLS